MCETVKVKCADGYMIINKSDYDQNPERYELYVESQQEHKPAGRVVEADGRATGKAQT